MIRSKIKPGKECTHLMCGSTCRRKKQIKKTPAPLKRTAIRKVSKKQTIILGERKLASEKDRAFFLQIWNTRPHTCFETGEWLGDEPLTLFFHHVLKRRKMEEFRYCEWNIVLLGWARHTNADNNMQFTPNVQLYFNYLTKHLDQIRSGEYIPSFKKFEDETTA